MYHILISKISNSKMIQVIPIMHNSSMCKSHLCPHTHTKNKGAVLSVSLYKFLQKYSVFIPAGSDFSSESVV